MRLFCKTTAKFCLLYYSDHPRLEEHQKSLQKSRHNQQWSNSSSRLPENPHVMWSGNTQRNFVQHPKQARSTSNWNSQIRGLHQLLLDKFMNEFIASTYLLR